MAKSRATKSRWLQRDGVPRELSHLQQELASWAGLLAATSRTSDAKFVRARYAVRCPASPEDPATNASAVGQEMKNPTASASMVKLSFAAVMDGAGREHRLLSHQDDAAGDLLAMRLELLWRAAPKLDHLSDRPAKCACR